MGLHTSCRSESSYFAWSFGQWFEFRMIFIMLQYNRLWSCFSCLLPNTINYSATSFSFSVSTFLASLGVLPKLQLKRKMSPKSWCPLKVCQINGLQLLQLLTFATEGKLLSSFLQNIILESKTIDESICEHRLERWVDGNPIYNTVIFFKRFCFLKGSHIKQMAGEESWQDF